jgi:hypothetical protein
MLNTKNQAGKIEQSAGRRDALNLPPVDVNRRYDIPTACACLGISRVRLYAKLKAAEIRPLKDGGRTFIPGSEIVRLSTFVDVVGPHEGHMRVIP